MGRPANPEGTLAMKLLTRTLLTLSLLVGVVALFNLERIQRLHTTITLFDEDVVVHNFSHLKDLVPTLEIKSPGTAFTFSRDERPLPERFIYRDQPRTVTDYLQRTTTTALLVIRDDAITYENYFLGTSQNDYRISWSVAKSFLSALFGIAVHEGHIRSLDQAVTDYVPALKGTGYDGVRIKDVLQMSSGVRFNEDYMDFDSDINRFGRNFALGGSFDDFAGTLVKEREPGTFLHYVSIDTHVLGMVLRSATGRPIGDYMEQKLWSKLQPESSLHYIIDNTGEPMVLGGMNMRTRDFARLGLLYLKHGRWNDEQIVPAEWVEASRTPDAPHLQPGQRDSAAMTLGYGYQWWIPEQADQELLAWGIYGQYIYINWPARVVIVKNSANLKFADNNYESVSEDVEFFRAVARSLPAHEN
jgi:CubicO group peptidase (beta-lactamase class C family)